jgi:agmatinase
MDYGVHTMSPLALTHISPAAMVSLIEDAVNTILSGTPSPDVLAVLGGEHSISSGTAQGLSRVFTGDDLVAVQIDAHADLRDEYEDSPYSHACAARRILEVCPVFQIGIRNISEQGESFREESGQVQTVFSEEACAPDAGFFEDLAEFVSGKQVFFTIDLDGLDPSIMPAVGTPEPGGILWDRMLEIARVVCRESAHVPVFDVVELAPIPGLIGPDFLAAKLIYKILSFILLSQ